MAYSPKGVMDVYEILIRWHAGYTISAIAAALSVDRKTVRRYVRAAEDAGLSRETPLPKPIFLAGSLPSFEPAGAVWRQDLGLGLFIHCQLCFRQYILPASICTR